MTRERKKTNACKNYTEYINALARNDRCVVLFVLSEI